ncbi:Uncharacterized protein PECH_005760 [Penicillium ucsense]|uniref:Rhodopsin domain-containing protein n=1 Tax=Penicillium ucsense TaxID=2839758 RepID=A0A8J8W263_9EURO|nr:Uncharacterized protein PECM_006223 [Penicillium ucsense]KAF7736172.1 Uncharacterized protein PECH_005760 [Penicillium ucsense]
MEFGSIPSQKLGDAIPENVFLGVSWALNGTAFAFVVFRLYAQLVAFRRLFIDDVLVVLAWIILLTATSVWQVNGRYLYKFDRVISGLDPVTPSFLSNWHRFMRSLAPLQILFYTALWCVKFSFLAFFYRLSCKVKWLRIWWVMVVVFTFGVYITSIADIEYKCSFESLEYILEHCPQLNHVHYENRTFWANCAGDVATDMMILSIPIMVLWNTKISRRKKIILLSIFSATILIMIIAIIRVAVKASLNHQTDVAWLCFWSIVEGNTAILISCVASMRQLFINAQAKGSREWSSNPTSTGQGVKSPHKITSPVLSISNPNAPSSPESDIPLSPMSMVHVRHDYEVTRAAANARGAEDYVKRNTGTWKISQSAL